MIALFNSQYLYTSDRGFILSIILLFSILFIVISIFRIDFKALTMVILQGSSPSLEVKQSQLDLLFLLKIQKR
jgi:hypothetical protein